MRMKSALALLITAAAGLAAWLSPLSAASTSPHASLGTYFFESVTASTGQALNGFITLHKDGTVTWADQSDFGAAGFFNSTTLGTWKKTGPDQVTIQGFYYRFDPAGAPVVLVRITSVGSLTLGHGVGTVDVWLPHQNPTLEQPLIPDADSITLTTYPIQ